MLISRYPRTASKLVNSASGQIRDGREARWAMHTLLMVCDFDRKARMNIDLRLFIAGIQFQTPMCFFQLDRSPLYWNLNAAPALQHIEDTSNLAAFSSSDKLMPPEAGALPIVGQGREIPRGIALLFFLTISTTRLKSASSPKLAKQALNHMSMNVVHVTVCSGLFIRRD